ncbi:V-type ATP synthase subunit C [Enterococcus sp.]|jgi:V/A-type H+-transporting ATPase subunit C|uniref:V-type ATP synthase subunit C n=1 Tax=Enterococcus sp. TaxID=35783 RepID=UPI0025C46B05|nr:V-type ATP synthase subunit C [Enterococcus sp.]
MEDIKYSTLNTRIRTYEAELISRSRYERMLSANSAEEVYALLRETVYGDFINEEDRVHDFEHVLIAELKRVYENLYQLTPDPSIVDYFALRYDYQNLKVLVKAKFMEADFSEFLVPIGTMPLSNLKELVYTRKSEIAEPPMIACIDEVFSYIENYHEIQSIDIIFDNHFWEHLWSIGKRYDDVFLQGIIQRQVDIFNISTALRCFAMNRHRGFISAVLADNGTLPAKELLEAITTSLEVFVQYLQNTPYKELINHSYDELVEKKTLNTFDLRKDNFLMGKLKEQKIVPFGPSAMIGYLYAKEIESKNLRIILIGKINKVPEETLRSRVRDTYE